MPATQAHIVSRLREEILPLQGFKPPANGRTVNFGLGSMRFAFPKAEFPLGAVHEFISAASEDAVASAGFVTGLLSSLMRTGGVTLWISSSRTIFPPALKAFDIEPDKIIFVELSKEKDVLWVMEEALKTNGLAAVVGEMKELSFTASRRLQLAVEQSRVTGFVLRSNSRNINTTACVTRWKITSLPSDLEDDMPGVGSPRWNVELLKVRNGKPGSWQIEWNAGKFRHVALVSMIKENQQTKTG